MSLPLPDPSNATERIPMFNLPGVLAALVIAGVLAAVALMIL